MASRQVIDLRPAEAVFHAYAGDSFDVTVKLTSASGPVDTTGWTWHSSVRLPGWTVSFSCTPVPSGVQLHLDPPQTALLQRAARRFDVLAIDPDGTARTVLAGSIDAAPRVTEPPHVQPLTGVVPAPLEPEPALVDTAS